MSAPRLVDLSHPIEDGMVTYKGLPAPLICDHLSRLQSREHYATGTDFQIGKITMVANEFSAAPAMVRGMGSFPVRAWAAMRYTDRNTGPRQRPSAC